MIFFVCLVLPTGGICECSDSLLEFRDSALVEGFGLDLD
jgi:hypothetical protein